ncbi:hypothetical protein BCF33_2672 [Hasllibacter halocynthiae]|uniref:Metallo-beta-lactamase domain-containing protein n=1 Tax=Hasllibacter halocynthiae TaxID=595589 RepID=A0A2T0X4D6_9RHOB|nr:MBL fold metallo-hydrolase [Hasllibacter halocynthiae]PRY93787.1 hypothetical protein BCF33_2672 [Hasllibacter halocynthiae]
MGKDGPGGGEGFVSICTACGTSYPPAAAPPPLCPICEDARQYVPDGGQGWTTPDRLAAGHANRWSRPEPDLFAIETAPAFGIGQRAFLVRTPAGNVLWDCLALLDAATREIVEALGGLAAIAISHPHYYTTMQDWADAFGAPVLLHEDDREWVMRPSPRVRFWSGEERELAPGCTLTRLGGHFAGGTALRWAAGCGGRGALLSSDIVQVAADRGRVSFMWSYPNMLPLPAETVGAIAEKLSRVPFERIYGAFDGRTVREGGGRVVRDSARLYRALLRGDGRPDPGPGGTAPPQGDLSR